MVLPADHPLAFSWAPGLSLAISPDGRQIAYVAQNPDAPPGPGRLQLHVRSLDSLAPRAIPGTEDARQPFFSPDGQWLGFFTATELKKVSLTGGNPLTLLEKINGGTWTFGTWTDDGSIIFGGDTRGLQRISADGGAPQKLTTVDTAQGESQHAQPDVLAGTGAVLFQVEFTQLRDPRIEAVQLETGERQVVVENARGPRYLASGHLVFRRDDVILVAPFDAARLAVTGPAVPLVDDVRRDRGTAGAEMAVSRAGTVAYVPAADAATQALGIVNRDGAFQSLGPPPNRFAQPRISPDGQYVAFEVARPGQDTEVHIYDVTRGATTRLTQQGREFGPSWRPNSRELTVSSVRPDARGIYLKDLSGAERLLIPNPSATTNLRNASWSPDGRLFAYTVQDGSQHDIWVLTMGDKPSAQPLLNGPSEEFGPRFSSDGRWMAYVSNESGRREVYIRRYPQGNRLAVSTGGGQSPVWASDGREVFFTGTYEGTLRLMVVAVTPDADSLKLGTPRPLLDMRVAGPTGAIEQYEAGSNVGAGYDIFPDGQRFVMVRGADPQGTREIVVVQNFFEEVKRLAPVR